MAGTGIALHLPSVPSVRMMLKSLSVLSVPITVKYLATATCRISSPSLTLMKMASLMKKNVRQPRRIARPVPASGVRPGMLMVTVKFPTRKILAGKKCTGGWYDLMRKMTLVRCTPIAGFGSLDTARPQTTRFVSKFGLQSMSNQDLVDSSMFLIHTLKTGPTMQN